jgi:post-segregation antitoxin (ccd killing protein)
MLKFKFKFDYCQNSIRKSFNTTLDKDLIEQLKYIKANTGQPISKLIEVAMNHIFKISNHLIILWIWSENIKSRRESYLFFINFKYLFKP